MPRAPRRRAPSARPAVTAVTAVTAVSTLARAGVVGPLAALGAACVDVAPPVTAPRPRASLGCDAATPCSTPGATAPGTRQLRFASARGPNPEGSFTTLRGEQTVVFQMDIAPVAATPLVDWTITATPDDGGYLGYVDWAPTSPRVAVDVTPGEIWRWRLPHGAPLSARALAISMVAELPADQGQPLLRDSVVVRQREVDVLRQEYADFSIPVPGASEVRTPADVAGATRFTWAQLNQGDYGVAVLTPRLLTKLGEMDAAAGGSLVLTSVFRNPAHHRFHMSVSGGFAKAQLSQHQYGTAVDVSTRRNLKTWNDLHAVAKRLGACAEPLKIATVNHVHADWRTSAPACPPGW